MGWGAAPTRAAARRDARCALGSTHPCSAHVACRSGMRRRQASQHLPSFLRAPLSHCPPSWYPSTDNFNYCSVPLSGSDAFLFAALALLVASVCMGKLQSVWVLIVGERGGLLGVLAWNLGAPEGGGMCTGKLWHQWQCWAEASLQQRLAPTFGLLCTAACSHPPLLQHTRCPTQRRPPVSAAPTGGCAGHPQGQQVDLHRLGHPQPCSCPLLPSLPSLRPNCSPNHLCRRLPGHPQLRGQP